jgi:hypothetical protein
MTTFVRHILPAILVVAGIVLFLVNPSTVQAEGAAGIIGAGLAIWLFGWLFRKGLEGEHDRDVEDAAREFLDDHGRWPTDEESAEFERSGRWPTSSTPSGSAGR